MIWSPVLAISLGAAVGALLRWQFGVPMNSLFPVLPLGTLAANLVGGYVIGLAVVGERTGSDHNHAPTAGLQQQESSAFRQG